MKESLFIFNFKKLPLAALASLVIILIVAIVLVFIQIPSNDYLAAIIDKEALLKNTPSPRIIFIGGSNLAFGLDSAWIEKETNRRVINLGLHASLGLSFMLEQAKAHIREGDILIISPEYALFEGLTYGEEESSVLLTAIGIYPKILKYTLSCKQMYIILGGSLQFLREKYRKLLLLSKKGLKIKEDKIYRKSGFNHYGDLTSHLSLARQPDNYNKCVRIKKEKDAPGSANYYVACLLLKKFNSYALSRHAKFFLMPSPYPRRLKYDGMNLIYRQLHQLTPIPILAFPEQFLFSDDYFFNTEYHLTAEGRKIRTQKVIALLKKALAG